MKFQILKLILTRDQELRAFSRKSIFKKQKTTYDHKNTHLVSHHDTCILSFFSKFVWKVDNNENRLMTAKGFLSSVPVTVVLYCTVEASIKIYLKYHDDKLFKKYLSRKPVPLRIGTVRDHPFRRNAILRCGIEQLGAILRNYKDKKGEGCIKPFCVVTFCQKY